MILESAQLLCNGIRKLDSNLEMEFGNYVYNNLYKQTHLNHPCSIWAGNSVENWVWLYFYFCELCSTYKNYITKKSFNLPALDNNHKSYLKLNPIFADVLKSFEDRFNKHHKYTPKFICKNITEPPNCTIYKDIEDVYLAYKMCLFNKWENLDKIEPKFNFSITSKFINFNEDRMFYYETLLKIMYGYNPIPEFDKKHLEKLEFLKPLLK